MNMKKINTLAFVAFATILFSSCSDDFLTVENPTQDSIEDYYTTLPHLQEAMVAAYCPLHWTDWSMNQYNPLLIMSDIMADQIWVGGADRTDNKYWHEMMDFSADPKNCMSALWVDAYSGVKRCNDIFTYMEWTKAAGNLDEETAKVFEAQARLLRVYYYSWLWKFWGNVVYYEKNLESPFLGTQYTADEVYGFMIKDLEACIALDVLPMKRPDEEVGYVTKAVAYMLYAEIVMYQKDTDRYATALSYMKEIITSTEYDLYDYSKLFTLDGEWCVESIWEVGYKTDDQQRSYDNVLAAGGSILPRLIGAYNLKGNSGKASGWGFAPVRKETYDSFKAGDVRKEASCFDVRSYEYDKRYQDTGFFLNKYQGALEDETNGNGAPDMRFGNNLRLYRYSETLLNAAELALELGTDQDQAKIWLNKVHSRSGLSDEVDLTLAAIQQERAWEFVGEGKRYWDLIRWGLAETVLVPDAYGYRTNSWTESKKYLPIPSSEIDASLNTLKQNNY